MRTLLVVLLAIIGVFATTGTSMANLVLNGSFESGLANWAAVNSVSVTSTEGSTDGPFAAAFSAGDNPNDGVISQVVPTLSGTTYSLEFDYGAFTAFTGTQTLRAEVLGAASLLDELFSDPGSNPTTFVPIVRTFVADASSITLRFSDQSITTTSIDLLLDSVRLNVVPEPSALAMLAIALGVSLRRRAGEGGRLGNRRHMP